MGNGILAHCISGDKYTGSFILYDTVISSNNNSSQIDFLSKYKVHKTEVGPPV